MKIEYIVPIIIFTFMVSYILVTIKTEDKVLHSCATHGVVILNDTLIKCEVVDENSN